MKRIAPFALLCCVTASAYAQETRDTVELREVVVTAARMPIERSVVSASVTVLDGDDLRARGIRTVEQALRGVSGATLVQTGSYGSFASLFLRGGESDYVQVLIDGVQVNSPGELFDFGNLTLENIERIELLRGPASVLYGSDAVAGVVQLFTRNGVARPHFDIIASGGMGSRVGAAADGSFGAGAVSGEVRGRAGRASYSAGFSHFRTEGAYAFNNEHSNTGLTGRLLFNADARTDVAASVRYSTNTFHYPTDGAGNLVDRNVFHEADGVTLGLDLGRRLSSRLETRLQLGFSRNDDRYDDSPDGPADTLGFYAYYSDERFERESADLRFNYALTENTVITIGGAYERQHERGSNLSESEFGPFPGSSGERRTNAATYAQLIGALSRFNFQLGTRLEDNQRFGTHSTFRGGVSARLADGLRARAAVGTGFKQPRFYEQFATGFVRGNPNLEPETSRSLELGTDLTIAASRISATWFAQRFRNLIQYLGVPALEDDPNYVNLGEAHADGLELEAAHSFGRIGAKATYTLLDTEVTDAGVGDDPLFIAGERLIRRPKHSAALLLSYARRGWTLSGSANYVGARGDLDFNEYPAQRVELEAYARIDVSAALPLRPALSATLKLENALNESYQEALNFPARGRVVFVGFRYGR